MNKQLSVIYFDKILPKIQCGFRKDFSTQHCLLLMLENGNRLLIITKFFEHSSPICEKLLIASLTIC